MAEAQVKALITKRAGTKKSLTAFINFLSKFNSESDVPNLEKRFHDIQEVRKKFIAYQDELEGLLEESDELLDYRVNFDDAYFDAITNAENLLSKFSKNYALAPAITVQTPNIGQTGPTSGTSNLIPPTNQQSDTMSTASQSPDQFTFPNTTQPIAMNQQSLDAVNQQLLLSQLSQNAFDNLHSSSLPTISLPTFSGNFDDCCLKGEASEVISAIGSSDGNYKVAWELLKERYDDLFIPSLSRLHLRALAALEEPTESWDSILIVLLREKLNSSARERWEDCSSGVVRPTIKNFIDFLKRRTQVEGSRAQFSASKPAQEKHTSRFNKHSQQAFAASTYEASCVFCNETGHQVYSCNQFAALTPYARFEASRNGGWCTNCLKKGYRSSKCTSQACCNCKQKHHTLLHFDKSNNFASETPKTQVSSHFAANCTNMQAQTSSQALLATALVDIVNHQGKSRTCRIFLDAGSQAHFITEEIASFLNLIKKPANIYVTGIDNTSTNVKFSTQAILRSRASKYEKSAGFLIVPQISHAMPTIVINHIELGIPKNIKLADPEFFKPSKVDALIGVKLFYKLLSIGQISLKNHSNAILQKTQLGWIVAGEVSLSSQPSRVSCHVSIHSDPPDINLTRFWEIEELPSGPTLSSEEKACEEHYALHTRRHPDGKYEVRLPFNSKKSALGESYSTALKRFYALERKFQQRPEIQRDYIEFLDEYLSLGHMSLADNQDARVTGYFLPHHTVLKEDSITTKTRVVFDGSAKTSSGISLNDSLMVIVNSEDAQYQKILFRRKTSEPIRTYVLNTATYGTAPASYLAIKTLFQLADDEEEHLPLAAKILRRDFYVDDCLSGAKTVAEAITLRDQLITMLKKGGFNLRKWASNHPALLIKDQEHPESSHMSLDPDSATKTLGIRWHARDDYFFYVVNISNQSNITKRTILSQIAKLFDPIGLLGPIIVHAKIIMQLLWKIGAAWDESVPIEIHSSWSDFRGQLPLIEKLHFPRGITLPNVTKSQLHGFCDASENAYGACLYLRSLDSKGQVCIRLISSKSRVAPVKPLTLPRLELCAALLLARLYCAVKPAILSDAHESYLWSDSTIVLHWIDTPAHRLKTFVSNRISEIQTLTSSCHWRHVSSQDNPADLISRGQLPSEFVEASIWFDGPLWLAKDISLWPKGVLTPIVIPELKPIIPNTFCMKIEIKEFNLLEKYSSFNKLQRIIAYILRFICNCKLSKTKRAFGPLQATELKRSHHLIIRIVQLSAFKTEIELIKNGEPLPPSSKLIPLNPILDEFGILRVGGRLACASIAEDQRHPILLPAQHFLTRIIILSEHLRLKHAGPQATLYSIRQVYWPINGRNITRNLISKCIPCFRAKPRLADHQMGILPKQRVTSSRSFLHVGVDYCGPFYIKEKRHHNRARIKTYVAVYICMCTKAIHLELVSDLTTEAFLASLKRLFSRRGKAVEIHSDNGTNFVGAKNELSELYELFNSKSHQAAIANFYNEERIEWQPIDVISTGRLHRYTSESVVSMATCSTAQTAFLEALTQGVPASADKILWNSTAINVSQDWRLSAYLRREFTSSQMGSRKNHCSSSRKGQRS
ncbi:uncharacterized protein LOC123270068 [Cotesia glomerata]|uniref:uncharacterized protein LOC123270068 n=1 Tax=Cotesia glomerata TaxID=32391 RepID=UPI001D017D34|nr:uncharacterized protein LOC123270068 [Cotesia glomerata]